MSTAGPIVGSITATSMDGATGTGDGIKATGGDLDANITIRQDVRKAISASGGVFPVNRTISIGGGLLSSTISGINGAITLPSSGLKGQVIINGTNGSGTWTSGQSIMVDGTTLSPVPYYTQTSASLGGGTVGLAPFHMYGSDCSPPNGRTAFQQGILESGFGVSSNTYPVVVKIRHYGPIQLSTGTNWNTAVTIDVQPLNTSGNGPDCAMWTEVSGMFTVHGPNEAGVTDANTIGLARASGVVPRAGLYRVRLNSGKILSANVTGTPEVVWPVPCIDDELPAYTFRVTPDCNHDETNDEEQPLWALSDCTTLCNIADFNRSGTVTVQDLFDFLAAWFARSLSADVNNTGTVTVQDIFDYLGTWFSCHS